MRHTSRVSVDGAVSSSVSSLARVSLRPCGDSHVTEEEKPVCFHPSVWLSALAANRERGPLPQAACLPSEGLPGAGRPLQKQHTGHGAPDVKSVVGMVRSGDAWWKRRWTWGRDKCTGPRACPPQDEAVGSVGKPPPAGSSRTRHEPANHRSSSRGPATEPAACLPAVRTSRQTGVPAPRPESNA